MLRKLFLYSSIILFTCLYLQTAHAAAPNPRTVVKVLTWDATIKDYSSKASGILLDNSQILTDYHVAKFAIDDPGRYQLVISLSTNVNTLPIFGFAARPDSISKNPLSQGLDLALLDFATSTEILGIKDLKFWTASDNKQTQGVNLSNYGTDISKLNIKNGTEIQTLGYPKDTLTYSSGHVIGHQYYPGNNIVYVNIGAPLSPGSSGGGVFDQDGNFVGITPGGWTNNQGRVIQGYFIPVTSINWWLDYLRQQPKDSISQTELPIPDGNTVLKIQGELCLLGDSEYCQSHQTIVAGAGSKAQQPLTVFQPNQPALIASVNSGKSPGTTVSRPSFLNRIFNWLFNR
jgi:hypothetical protein